MTKRYIKNPIQVSAVQFTNDNKTQVCDWAVSLQQNITPDLDKENNPILKIPTLEGEMICAVGDYLIVEPFPTDWRKLYPCKKEIFLKTYEEIPSFEPLILPEGCERECVFSPFTHNNGGICCKTWRKFV